MKGKVEDLVKRPGLMRGDKGSKPFLHQAKREKGSNRKLQQVVGRSPLFKQEIWSRMVGATLQAISRLLGQETSRPRRAQKSLPKPVSAENVDRAHQMLERLMLFLHEVAHHSVAARLVLEEKQLRADLSAEARRALDNRRESLTSERDVRIYPGDLFYRDDVITRLR